MAAPILRAKPTTEAGYTFPPGPAPKPLVGSSLDFSHNPLQFVTGLQRFGDAATVRFMGGFKLVAFFTPAAARYFLVENPRNFNSRMFNAVLQPLLGEGLLTIDGEFHRQQRRLVQPAFHKKRIESYAGTMVAHTEDMLATWRPGETRDLAMDMQRLTLRIVAKTLFDVDLYDANSHELGQAFNDVILFPAGRRLSWQSLVRIDAPFTPYGRYMRGRAKLDQTVYGIIADRRAKPVDTGDVLSMLLAAQDDDGAVMTDKQVRDQTMTFFGAGHETTANALAWTFYLLSEHPQAMQTLRDELRRVLAGRAPTVDDLPQLVYTEMVIKEAMRLYPPAWSIGRTAEEAFTIGEYHMPAGQAVMFPQWVIHRKPEIWGPDAAEFKPERFDAEHPQEVPQFAYFPFGGGPRMCIGMPFAQMEARLLLATIAQRFQPKLMPGFPVTPEPHITLRPKHGLKMTLE